MDPFSYLSFLTSIVLALGITRILSGIGQLLQARDRIVPYWPHLVWTLNVFLYLVLNWWILFRWRLESQWNFFLFLFVLLSPTLGFLLSVLLFPDSLKQDLDLKKHFYANHRSFFILAALLAPIDLVDTLLKGWAHLLAQGPFYILFLAMAFGLNIVAAITRDERYHSFFAVFFFLYLLVFIGINLRVLS
jgi:hypothetical protein